MYPKEIINLASLQNKTTPSAGEILGPAGSYGNSTGRHTHTEIESWDFSGYWLETCEMLDWILYMKYGEESLRGFLNSDVVEISRKKCKGVKAWADTEILEDYEKLTREKSIVFINKYKMIIRCRNKRNTTLYNSKAVFNM